MSKVYFTHTTKLDAVKYGLVPAATIAMKREGNKFYYGVCICSKQDNFSKKLGREIATQRMEKHFGVLGVPEVLTSSSLTENQQNIEQLYQLAGSVVVKSKRWKKKITNFNLEQKSLESQKNDK